MLLLCLYSLPCLAPYKEFKILVTIIKDKHYGEIPPIMPFTELMMQSESSGELHCINPIGCYGLFQFKEKTLRGLGFRGNVMRLSKRQQIVYLNKYRALNRIKLHDYINRFAGTRFKDIYITENGILAAAHLGGPGSVKKLFDKSIDSHDANGTYLLDYMFKFSNTYN